MLQIKIDKNDLAAFGIKARELHAVAQGKYLRMRIGQLLAAQGKKNIEESTPDGKTSYLPLKPATLKGKIQTFTPSRGKNKGIARVKKGSAKPLVRTGLLKRSISFSLRGSKTYLTAVNYGTYHQYGTRKMPARPIFSIRPENKEDILLIIRKTIQTIIHKK